MFSDELPDVGTPEEAKRKMMDGYNGFVDICAKFVTITDYYTDKARKGQPLPSDFNVAYNANYNRLKNADVDDFGSLLALNAVVYLQFIDEIKDNLDFYYDLLDHEDDDPELSDYDKACDYLTCKDEFTDLGNKLTSYSKAIVQQRDVDNHFNDPQYDPNTREYI